MTKNYSHSKRSLLEKCPYAYFCQYYAPGFSPPRKGGQTLLFAQGPSHPSLNANEIELAAKLNKLVGSAQHAGTVLHALIAQSLKHPDWRPDWFRRKAVERFQQLPEGVDFVERANGLIDAEERIERARQSMLTALSTFFENEAVRTLVGELSTATEEPLIERPLGGIDPIRGFSIRGRIDVSFRRMAHVEVVDWKMGKSQGDEDSLQMGLYGVWATRKFSVAPQSVRVRRVFLGDARIEEGRPLSHRSVRRISARLSQDIEAMEFLHPYGIAGNAQAFTPKPKEKVCAVCKFRALCPAVACMTQ